MFKKKTFEENLLQKSNNSSAFILPALFTVSQHTAFQVAQIKTFATRR